MTRFKCPTVPKFRRQKKPDSPDLAFIQVRRQRVYLGQYDAPETRQRYARIVGEMATSNGELPVSSSEITIVEVANRFRKHAESYYAAATNPGAEPAQFRIALKPVITLYGDTPAAEFGARQLKVCREWFVNSGYARVYCNSCVKRIRRVVKWAASEDLVPAEAWHRLMTIDPLKRGRTKAPETKPILPVADATMYATLPYLTPTVRAMVQLQRHTGMRPGEVAIVRSCDIDTSGKVWVFTPHRHKTEHHGKARKVFIGPRGQEILRAWLRTDLAAYVFSPKQSEAERREVMHAARKTPLSCGNKPGSNRKAKPRKTPGLAFDTCSYNASIRAACRKAFPPPKELTGESIKAWHREHVWTPNQLRHTFATHVRREHGLESAQVLLGHSACDVTQIYAERDLTKAAAVALKIG